jgi:hypothetical protein
VSDSEGAAIVPENAVEDLAYRKRRAVDGAIRHCFRPSESVAGIADQHEDALAALSGQFRLGSREHVAWTLKLAIHGTVAGRETAQLERSDQCGGLCEADAGSARQLFWTSNRERTETAVLGQQGRRQVESTLSTKATPDDERKKLAL